MEGNFLPVTLRLLIKEIGVSYHEGLLHSRVCKNRNTYVQLSRSQKWAHGVQTIFINLSKKNVFNFLERLLKYSFFFQPLSYVRPDFLHVL